MEERGYDISGSGVIKWKGQIIARIEQISIHIYPESISLNIRRIPATASLIKALLSSDELKLEVITEVNNFFYIAKEAMINRFTIEGKKGEILYLTDIEMITLEIEKMPKHALSEKVWNR